MKNKYFTEIERYKLESLFKENVPVKQIAEHFGKCKATIYNEIKRGKVTLLSSELTSYTVYKADVAQRKYLENCKNKGPDFKIGNDHDFARFVEDKILHDKWSPGAIAGFVKTHKMKFPTKVCKTTLYNYVKNGLFLNVTYKDLPYGSNVPKKASQRSSVALCNIKGQSIEARPKYVYERKDYGHWEMDTVVSGIGKGKECLLVLSERMTRQEIIIKMKDRTQHSVVKALDKLEFRYGSRRFREVFKTITVDNGVEFLDFTAIEKSRYNKHLKRTTVYYCHPYCSSERGTNENINKMIRRFFPKGCSIGMYDDDYIKHVEDWVNNYPREIFGYMSTYEYMLTLGIA